MTQQNNTMSTKEQLAAAYKCASQGITVLTSAPAAGQCAPQVVTIRVRSPSPLKLSTTKPTLLPKTIRHSANPVVLGASQRLTHHVLLPNSSMNYIFPTLDYNESRKRQEMESWRIPEYKRRNTEGVSKHLRHLSKKICKKICKKGTISCNEIANELLAEFTNASPMASPITKNDQKNIKRRMSNVLNVLRAMNIISKEKKIIRWLGLPMNSLQKLINLEKDKQHRVERIKLKTQQLHELILKQISLKNLVERNRAKESNYGPPPKSAIQLPFTILNTSGKTVIDCKFNDKMKYLFNFDNKFEIYNETEVLKKMGLVLGLHKGECSEADLQKAKSMVSQSLESYVLQMATGWTDTSLPEVGAGLSSLSLSDPVSPINDF